MCNAYFHTVCIYCCNVCNVSFELNCCFKIVPSVRRTTMVVLQGVWAGGEEGRREWEQVRKKWKGREEKDQACMYLDWEYVVAGCAAFFVGTVALGWVAVVVIVEDDRLPGYSLLFSWRICCSCCWCRVCCCCDCFNLFMTCWCCCFCCCFLGGIGGPSQLWSAASLCLVTMCTRISTDN